MHHPPGADVNKSTANNDQTVLSAACVGGHLQVVELLLKNNANVAHVLKVAAVVWCGAVWCGKVWSLLLFFLILCSV